MRISRLALGCKLDLGNLQVALLVVITFRIPVNRNELVSLYRLSSCTYFFKISFNHNALCSCNSFGRCTHLSKYLSSSRSVVVKKVFRSATRASG